MPNEMQKILLDRRAHFNQLFRQQKHLHPHIDAPMFADFLNNHVQALVKDIDSGPQLTQLVEAIYQHALILASKSWLGDFRDLIDPLWTNILPKLGDLLLAKPQHNLRLLGNALVKLKSSSNKTRWLNLLDNSARPGLDQIQFEKMVAVSIWMAGLSQYREAVLPELETLDRDLCEALLGEKATSTHNALAQKKQLMQSPWLQSDIEKPHEQCRIGGSILLDGEFTQLPQVTQHDDQIFVSCGESCYQLIADHFGHALQTVQDAAFVRFILSQANPSQSEISHQLRQSGVSILPPDVESLTSIATCSHSCALTVRESYQIILFARSNNAH